MFGTRELFAAGYAEATWKATDRLSLFGGLRGDRYSFKTVALSGLGAWSGNVGQGIFSPKLGVAYRVADTVDLYGNWARFIRTTRAA